MKSKKQQILAIVYCRREGTPDLFSQLLGTGVLIIPALKRLLSKSKQNDPGQLKENLKLHQSAELELKSLRLVVAHKESLSALIELDYLKFFKKVQVSVRRLKFLRKCLKNDIIPEFFKFRVPENGFFSDQAVHNFQFKLLRTETSRSKEDRKITRRC